ncbi:MOSC domain-containing protein [Actinomadura rayongensis]|uniref:MOSC domain-containing protein n=1 Tax=Actinomadura rayongensis TaxID=1429076 RepID=A0A6I4WE65_9ACTN|nr:MOSC N-terminal beta barrel domain-containing protein [Actinomadura rayongensis]MXQ67353.1 MOSC domain-containing protein [Actinomadura rayongensis]
MGSVVAVRRYPVKSMLGEDVEAVPVGASGLAGDRAFALVDVASGRVASAKNPRLWRSLLGVDVATVGDGVRLTFADGRTLCSADPDADALLSDFVGRPVRLTATPPEAASLDRAVPDEVLTHGETADVPVEPTALPAGSFHDFAPVHLITTSTLDAIGAEAGDAVCAIRYRPNLIVRTPEAGYTENAWVGHDVSVGDAVLRIIAPTPRCAVPTLEQGMLPRFRDALRVPARDNLVEPRPGMGPHACAGVYATVTRPGHVSPGDTVTVL